MAGVESVRASVLRGKMGLVKRFSLGVRTLVGQTMLGTALRMGVPILGAAAAMGLAGCDMAKVECTEGEDITINQGLAAQISQRVREGTVGFVAQSRLELADVALENARVFIKFGTNGRLVGMDSDGNFKFITSPDEAPFEPCGVAPCSPFTGPEFAGKVFPWGVQRSFEGTMLFSSAEASDLWAGYGKVVDRLWGEQIYSKDDYHAIYTLRYTYDEYGNPIEKRVYLQTNSEGYVVDNEGNPLDSTEAALESGKDISHIMDPSVAPGGENEGGEPKSPEELGLPGMDGYFAVNHETDALSWGDVDDNGNPIPRPEWADSSWNPVPDYNIPLKDLIAGLPEGVTLADYAIPLEFKLTIKDNRGTGTEVTLDQVFTLADIENGTVIELPAEFRGGSTVDVTLTFTGTPNGPIPVIPDTALIYGGAVEVKGSAVIEGECETPQSADGGSD